MGEIFKKERHEKFGAEDVGRLERQGQQKFDILGEIVDVNDVKNAIKRSKDAGLAVNLDIHYSDTWADPHKQLVPAAWQNLDFGALKDSVYRYTCQVLETLNRDGLMPEMVQIGNEINPGMLLPFGSVEEAGWAKLGELLNAGIRAVREVSEHSDTKTQIILHVAQPENVKLWFMGITTAGKVNDFEIIGFSYYSKWSEASMHEISGYVREFKDTFKKEVMIVETAYPWTGDNNDTYGNIIGSADAESGYPVTQEGQLKYLTDLTKSIIEGGGMGIMIWEPAWITSQARDLWGKGSAWENCTLFDFGGNVNKGMEFYSVKY